MLQNQEYVGLLIAAARRRLKQAVLSRIEAHRLSPQQFWCILALHDQPFASLGELARRQRIDAPTASRVVTGLARRKLLRLELSADDRRRARIALTPSGAELARTLVPIAASVRAAAVDGLTRAEHEALRALLRRVIENLEKFELHEEAPPARPRAARRKRSTVGGSA